MMYAPSHCSADEDWLWVAVQVRRFAMNARGRRELRDADDWMG